MKKLSIAVLLLAFFIGKLASAQQYRPYGLSGTGVPTTPVYVGQPWFLDEYYVPNLPSCLGWPYFQGEQFIGSYSGPFYDGWGTFCDVGMQHIVWQGNFGQGADCSSSPCVLECNTDLEAPYDVPMGGWFPAYTTAGTRNLSITITSCVPPGSGPGQGPGYGDLLAQWSGTLTVLPPPPSPTPPCPGSGYTPPTANAPVLIDPVAAGLVTPNGSIVSNSTKLANASTKYAVQGAAADGVTQLLLQIPAAHAGDILTVKVVDENNQWTSAADDGGLFDPVVGTPSNAAGSLTVTAQGSSYPMAVAMYLAPTNFHRGTQDDSSVKRAITFTVSTSGNAQCPGNNGQTSTASTAAIIVRPPVVLVHGLWSSGTGTWALFSPQNSQNWSLWADMNPEGQEVDYSSPVGITASTPSYSPNPTVTEAALGFSYNAPSVLLQTRTFIHNYGIHWKVAAVQGDVVAHSMGGDIVRTMGALSNYTTQSDYGLGPIHKLITIGTPHRGTPVAVDLLPSGLGDANACVRDALATKSNPSFQTVTLATGIVVNGAVGDLAAAPTNLPPTEPFPMAYLAATTNAANLANVDSLGSTSYWLRLGCITLFGNSGLAYDLTPSLWNNVFGGEANDGVVPITSQLNQTGSLLQAAGGQSANTFQGIIHSPGFEALNFSPPTEVGPQNSIADAVVNLLNEATNGPDFH